jgi:hypothetical protein
LKELDDDNECDYYYYVFGGKYENEKKSNPFKEEKDKFRDNFVYDDITENDKENLDELPSQRNRRNERAKRNSNVFEKWNRNIQSGGVSISAFSDLESLSPLEKYSKIHNQVIQDCLYFMLNRLRNLRILSLRGFGLPSVLLPLSDFPSSLSSYSIVSASLQFLLIPALKLKDEIKKNSNSEIDKKNVKKSEGVDMNLSLVFPCLEWVDSFILCSGNNDDYIGSESNKFNPCINEDSLKFASNADDDITQFSIKNDPLFMPLYSDSDLLDYCPSYFFPINKSRYAI